jgi:hypothetical protein
MDERIKIEVVDLTGIEANRTPSRIATSRSQLACRVQKHAATAANARKRLDAENRQ